MKIKIEGQDFIGFTTATVSRNFLNVCGEFSFTTSPLNLTNNGYPIKVQQECEILVENEIFLTGFIEQIDVRVNAGNVIITASGRDKTCDLVDSTVDFLILSEFNGNVTLRQICATVLNKLNILNVLVVDKIDPKPFTIGDYIAPFTAESGFEFLQKYSKKRQVLLTTEGLGNLVITQAVDGISNPLVLNTRLINKFTGQNNNILRSHYNRNTSSEYNLYRSYSQLSTITLDMSNEIGGAGALVSVDQVTSQAGQAINTDIRNSRQYVFIADTPIDNETNDQRAIWEMNYRRSKGEFYNCSVQDHTFDGINIWPLNTLVQIFDDFSGLEGVTMLIDSLNFTESVSEGKQTHLGLVNNLAYSLQVEQNYRQALSEGNRNNYFVPSS